VTSVSCSSNAATSALDSTYFNCVVATLAARDRTVGTDAGRRLAGLGFATICVDECGRRTAR
jgi:hypothetical protein